MSIAVHAGAPEAQYMQLLYNQTARAAWIAETVGDIDLLGADGITFDLEGYMSANPNHTAPALTSFLSDVRAAGEVAVATAHGR